VSEQPVLQTKEGVERRIRRDDRANGVEIAINQYAPDTGSAPSRSITKVMNTASSSTVQLTVELDGRSSS
jgi:hypothetical protein